MFKDKLKMEMKQEIASLRQDIDHKLFEEQKASLAEAQGHIAKLEEWNAEAKETLLKMLNRMRHMQDKITDLEVRLQRNNIHIFGLPEEIEGSSIISYLDQLFKSELVLPEGISLQIQRTHRTPPQKPQVAL